MEGLKSFIKLRSLECLINDDLIIENNLHLHFPCLQHVKLTFDQKVWSVINRLFHAMSSCSPASMNLNILRKDHFELSSEHLPDLPKKLFSRMADLYFHIEGTRPCYTVTYDIVGYCVAQSPVLDRLLVVGIPKQYRLLRELRMSLPPSVMSLQLRSGGNGEEIAEELIKLLKHRQKQGVPPLEFLQLKECGRPSKAQIVHLKKFAKEVELDPAE